MQLTRTHRILIGLVIAGALIIAGIGFAGSYAAVRELALQKGFGTFSYFFPIGIDAGICVLLALDLLLTWLRIPFPLLRQTAWVLTAATIAFNGAAAWPDPLGVGMHAVIPVLFVVAVEAARHAVGRIADITADKHMEGVRITRWLLSPVPTFRLWRRMKLWELRSYEQVIKLEQERLIYQARLQARFGRGWRRKAPVEALMPLRLARYGVPLAETAPAGLAAAGIEPAVLPAQPHAQPPQLQQPAVLAQAPAGSGVQAPTGSGVQAPTGSGVQAPIPVGAEAPAGMPAAGPVTHESQWFAAQTVSPESYEGTYNPQIVEGLEPMPVPVPQGPEDVPPSGPEEFVPYPEYVEEPQAPVNEFEEDVFKITWSYVQDNDQFPSDAELAQLVAAHYGLQEFPAADTDLLYGLVPGIQKRVQEAMAEHDTA
ncbi:DUF2637 domain-containing protein [Streptomyces sp. bgisy060]|uniref:DUF2637 domain-containing protein n=1 Tax=Streptomyces sp. bgisy060 TaxID=3413775 RepID=UPI003EBB8EFC